ncbi:uncharacterized protein LOC111088670 [Limulus polyphemus]|uniref:Uncharacterized protein LOC111088670 n=1 Tax=Limulus polyphemus TaxID=6850 RepID=A0ABM1TGV5_LIMPO|nr:uncharacterized protein LOC111088670 [Limulus polyphemus]
MGNLSMFIHRETERYMVQSLPPDIAPLSPEVVELGQADKDFGRLFPPPEFAMPSDTLSEDSVRPSTVFSDIISQTLLITQPSHHLSLSLVPAMNVKLVRLTLLGHISVVMTLTICKPVYLSLKLLQALTTPFFLGHHHHPALQQL